MKSSPALHHYAMQYNNGADDDNNPNRKHILL